MSHYKIGKQTKEGRFKIQRSKDKEFLIGSREIAVKGGSIVSNIMVKPIYHKSFNQKNTTVDVLNIKNRADKNNLRDPRHKFKHYLLQRYPKL